MDQSQENSNASKLVLLKQDLQFENALSRLRQRNSQKKRKPSDTSGNSLIQSRNASMKKFDKKASLKVRYFQAFSDCILILKITIQARKSHLF